MTCTACPFSMTEESEVAQNLGCLPGPGEILRMARSTGRTWGCHENEARPCAGFVAEAAERQMPIDKGAPLLSYERWYHQGEDAA